MRDKESLWTSRLAAFFWGVVWLVIAGVLAGLAIYHLKNVAMLAFNGVETTAVVSDYNPRRCGSRKRRRICHDHTITASEFGSKVVALDGQAMVGSRVYVTFEQNNHANIRVGRKPTFETLEFLDWGSLMLFAAGAFISVTSVLQITQATLGLGRYRKPARDSRPEVKQIFEKVRRFLDDEAAQNDALPEVFRRRLLASPPRDYVANGVGDFGRTATNPIPVNGPIGELLYLSSLVVPDAVPARDVPIVFHRLGSQDEIDVFEVVAEDGRTWDVLYFSPYFPRKSRAMPAGYQRLSHTRRRFLIRGTTSFVADFPAKIYEATAECTTRFFGISIADPKLKSLERSHPVRPQTQTATLQRLQV